MVENDLTFEKGKRCSLHKQKNQDKYVYYKKGVRSRTMSILHGGSGLKGEPAAPVHSLLYLFIKWENMFVEYQAGGETERNQWAFSHPKQEEGHNLHYHILNSEWLYL